MTTDAPRVPCKICGAKILAATLDRNNGLCGRCAKSHRPCIYCGDYVSEPLKDGIFAHMGCWVRQRQVEESFGWQSVSDIDWNAVRQLLHQAATRLFQTVGGRHQSSERIALLFFVRVQDFIEITVREVGQGDLLKRLSDAQWDKDLSRLDSSFSVMCEKLSEQDYFDASETVTRMLERILLEEGNELAKVNFHFLPRVQVAWSVRCD